MVAGRGRLTDVERRERTVSGAELQRQVTDLAELTGWAWCHFRALRNRRGIWQVPVEGPLGVGWPDLFLASTARGRVGAIEIKRQVNDPVTAEQARCHVVLRAAGLEVLVVRPSDLRDPIEASEVYRWLTR
jgi:hypothetical protein